MIVTAFFFHFLLIQKVQIFTRIVVLHIIVVASIFEERRSPFDQTNCFGGLYRLYAGADLPQNRLSALFTLKGF